MKKVLLILLGLVLIVGCSKEERTLSDILDENNYLILDVRTQEEYNESHIKDAINIPYDEIDANTELDKTMTILVYCKSGTRSGIAYESLKKLGYDVVDLGAMDSIDLEKE